jgi:hypothetical protein
VKRFDEAIEKTDILTGRLREEEIVIYLLAAIAGLVLIFSLLTGKFDESIAVIFFLLVVISWWLASVLHMSKDAKRRIAGSIIFVILILGFSRLLSPAGSAAFGIIGIAVFLGIGFIWWQKRFEWP